MKRLPDGRVRFEGEEDLPPVALSCATTEWNRTGDWRSREPVFRDLTPPCTAACPVGKDVADELGLFAQGRVREAGELLLSANPLPSVTGRVCPHPCTSACNRAQLGGALDMPGLERALGDALLGERIVLRAAPSTGARVAVVGAGPAGLTAAHFLALAGHAVTLYAREDRPGGLLRTGIPPYRLPRAILDAEVERALRPGVRFEGGRKLGADLELAALVREFDAVLVAVGLHASRRLGIPGEGLDGVVGGVSMLASLHRGEAAPAGEQVIVVGGGNTAFDCARSLRRLGRKVTVVYRRGRADMPAIGEEIEEAVEEGVAIEEWVQPMVIRSPNGRARWVHLVRTRPGAPDASGRSRPEPIPGTDFVLPLDLLVVAAGEELDPAGLPEALVERGAVRSSHDRRAVEGVFACGDCTGSGGTVAHAIGAGRRAAADICAALGAGVAPVVEPVSSRGAAAQVAGFERLRTHYFPPLAPHLRGRLAPALRLKGGEVRLGFDAEVARREAARCLSCGTCTGCDNCFQFCADLAVERADPGRYRVVTSRCKGCGICVQECPRGAVELREIGGERGD